mgnify:CR=1 FL=1
MFVGEISSAFDFQHHFWLKQKSCWNSIRGNKNNVLENFHENGEKFHRKALGVWCVGKEHKTTREEACRVKNRKDLLSWENFRHHSTGNKTSSFLINTNSKKKERWSIFHFSQEIIVWWRLLCSVEKKQLRRRRRKRITWRWSTNYYFQDKIIRHLAPIWLVYRKPSSWINIAKRER